MTDRRTADRRPATGHEQDAHGGMAERGVTRMPMGMGEHGGMSAEDRARMLVQHHRQTLWIPFTLVLLGVWLMLSPFVFGYTNPSLVAQRVVEVTDMRGLPPIADRATWLVWSDVLSGAALVLLSLLWALRPRWLWAPWAACFVGIWLLFAPLVLWSPVASAYATDTLVGTLVIALTILIPGMPGMLLIMQMGPEVPPGWSYNPSSWLQRGPIIVLGFLGLFASRYLSAYQLGYVDWIWDPFFGGGTMRILDSDVSLAWPISDAGLGATAYTLEALMGFMGSPKRWRTMPWMVLFFGILVVPLGLVSITLVILQPVMVGTWCTLCLFTAAAMLAMIPLTLDEVVAMLQFMARAVREEGQSFWRTFWLGGTTEGGAEDERAPDFESPLRTKLPAMVWGVTIPWNLLLATAVGLWLLAAPDVLGTQGLAGNSNHLVGAAAAVVAVIAMAEVTRAARFLNVPLGLWVVATPFLLGGMDGLALWSNLLAGAALVALSLPRGPVHERYSDWDRFVR